MAGSPLTQNISVPHVEALKYKGASREVELAILSRLQKYFPHPRNIVFIQEHHR
jgi:hypothetical protein